MKELKDLLKDTISSVKECRQFAKQRGKKGMYLDAIQLEAMADAYQQIAFKINKILNEAKSRSDSGGK